MNVLLSCVGRRCYMVDYFRQAIVPDGRVIATNSEFDTTGMQVADVAYVLPRVDDSTYIDNLLEISKKEEVSLVVSLFDIDLPYLANARSRFIDAGIQVAISDPHIVNIANDKWLTFKYLLQHGIPTPKTFVSLQEAISALSCGLLEFPVFIKPRWGMGSISIFKAENKEELEFFYRFTLKQIETSYLKIVSGKNVLETVVIQEFVPGNEFGLDVFNDLEGNHLTTIVKRKLAMRSGETDVAITVDHPVLMHTGERISSLLRHRGNLDIDILVPDSGIPYVLEFNARFGGGYPFSHLAGARFPEALVAMVRGDKPEVGEVRLGVKGLKSIDLMTCT